MPDLPLLICQRACSHLNVCVQACASFLAAVGGLTCSKCEGGVEAMTAEQNAARKHAGAALAAVRTSGSCNNLFGPTRCHLRYHTSAQMLLPSR